MQEAVSSWISKQKEMIAIAERLLDHQREVNQQLERIANDIHDIRVHVEQTM